MSGRVAVFGMASLALAGCGQVDRNRVGSETLGGGAGTSHMQPTGGMASGGTAGAGDDVAGRGGALAPSPMSCLYPRTKVAPISGEETDVPDYTTSAAYPLRVSAEQWGGLAATFDINGDWVSDLLIRDRQASRYRLLLTGPAPDVFVFGEPSECRALLDLPEGRVMLRDLDRDDVPDFVVGLKQGIVAYLNHEHGLEQVLDYRFAGVTDRAQLINLDAIDLNADGRPDLVVGFDRLQTEAPIAFDTGFVSFLQGEDGHFAPGVSWTTTWRDATTSGRFVFAGYMAAGHFRSSELATVVLVGQDRDTSQAALLETAFQPGVEPTPLQLDSPPRMYQAFALPQADGTDLLAVVCEDALRVYDLRSGTPTELYVVELANDGSWSHELGGGPESPRYYFVDIDRDGDEDFFERSFETPDELTFRVNLDNSAFGEPQRIGVGTAHATEAPFVAVGPTSGIVDEVLEAMTGQSTASIYTLFSRKYAAN